MYKKCIKIGENARIRTAAVVVILFAFKTKKLHAKLTLTRPQFKTSIFPLPSDLTVPSAAYRKKTKFSLKHAIPYIVYRYSV